MKEYPREKLERIVIGTLLNEYGQDKFYAGSKASLRNDLFKDKRNAFIFGVIESMNKEGMTQTTPYDVMMYCHDKGIKYGNPTNFAVYMCEVSENYAFNGFKGYVRQLVKIYINEKRHGKQ